MFFFYHVFLSHVHFRCFFEVNHHVFEGVLLVYKELGGAKTVFSEEKRIVLTPFDTSHVKNIFTALRDLVYFGRGYLVPREDERKVLVFLHYTFRYLEVIGGDAIFIMYLL